MRWAIRLSLLFMILAQPCVGQEKLSRKQKKELKKLQKAEKLESAIKSGTFRVSTSKFQDASGNFIGARGGILYIKKSEGEFMEFYLGSESYISTGFRIINYRTEGSLHKKDIRVYFKGAIEGALWNFVLTIEDSGATRLQIDNPTRKSISYLGKTQPINK